MKFVCPQCRGVSMKINESIELRLDSRSDEIAVQTLKSLKCGFDALGVYEVSRRGSLDSESVDHRGYYVDDCTIASIEKMIKQCLEPKKFGCRCRIHLLFSQVNNFGRWNWLDEIPHKERFKLQTA